jgi:hypothetical protein
MEGASMDRQRDPAGYPQGDPNEIIRDLIMAGASDEELLDAARGYTTEDETVERVITTALDHHLPEDVRHRQQVRWYRRAVNDNQVWAMYEAGTLWSVAGSDDTYLGEDLTHDSPQYPSEKESIGSSGGMCAIDDEIELDDFVSAEEARQWIVQAAEHGLRRACLEAACWNLDDERAAGWLRIAFGDGDEDVELDRHDLAATALLMARVLDKGSDPEAGTWYRIAVECPRWDSFVYGGLSWVEAASEYALWAHKQGDDRLCAAWAYRLLENAANSGPDDRNYMENEYKTYRYAWQIAASAEFARRKLVHHLLTEHELPEEQRLEIVLLLSSDRLFGQETWDVVRVALDAPMMESFTLRRYVSVGAARHRRELDVPINGELAWAIIDWLLEEAVPAVFRFMGMEQTATSFAQLVPADLRRADVWKWKSDVKHSGVGSDLSRSMESLSDSDHLFIYTGTAKRLVSEVVTRAGFGERPNLFTTVERKFYEEFADVDMNSSHWFLLRGKTTWLGMYCATAAEGTADQWIAWWKCAGGIMTSAILSALLTLGGEFNIDWSEDVASDKSFNRRWQELGATLDRSFSLFLQRAGDS